MKSAGTSAMRSTKAGSPERGGEKSQITTGSPSLASGVSVNDGGHRASGLCERRPVAQRSTRTHASHRGATFQADLLGVRIQQGMVLIEQLRIAWQVPLEERLVGIVAAELPARHHPIEDALRVGVYDE